MRDFESSCHLKVRYDNRRHARRARQQIQPGAVRLSIYRCEFCGFYHLGHLPKVVRNGSVPREEWL